MKKKYLIYFLQCIITVITNTVYGQMRPNEISGLQLWLRADSNIVLNGSNVSSWNDCSGNNNNASQLNGDNQPFIANSILNGLPIIRFDGTNDILNGTTIPGINSSSMSIFIVANGQNQSTGVLTSYFEIGNYSTGFSFARDLRSSYAALFAYTNTKYIQTQTGSLPNVGFDFKLLEFIKTFNSNAKLYLDGIETPKGGSNVASLIGTFTNSSYHIGQFAGFNYLKGDIAEIIVFNKSLNDSERLNVEYYLQNKYCKKLDLGIDIINTNFCQDTIHAGQGYNNYFWNNASTSESITIKKSGKYTVTVNKLGLTQKDSINISYPEIAIKDTAICIGKSITLSTNLNNNYTFKWSTNETTSNITTNIPGIYWISVTDKDKCFSVDTFLISIDDISKTIDLGSDKTICKNEYIQLQKPSPLPEGLKYIWSDNSTYSDLQIIQTGYYSLTVTSKNGCLASDNINITISGEAPNTDFTLSLTNDLTISLTNQTISTTTSLIWDFGDGTTSKDTNPIHSYEIGGKYNISLIASNGSCSNPKTININLPEINKNNLILWLRADSLTTSSNNYVSVWKDLSGNNNDAIQYDSSKQPKLVKGILNKNIAIRFDGIDDVLNGTILKDIDKSSISIFIIASGETQIGGITAFFEIPKYSTGFSFAQHTSSDYEFLTLYNNNAHNGTKTYSLPNTGYNFKILEGIKSYANNTKLYINGIEPGYSTESSMSQNNNYTLNNSFINNNYEIGLFQDFNNFKGKIAEIIIYKRALNTIERQNIERYLRYRYAKRPVNLGDDISIQNSLCDTIIHAGKGYKKYLWSTGDTTEFITINKSSSYGIQTKDSLDFESTDNIKVTFNVEPHLIPDTTICPKASLSWDTKLNTTDFSFKWSTGETTSSIIIKNAGDYILTVNDKYGCSYISDTVTVKIDDFDKSIDLGNDTTLCKNNELELVKGADRAVQYSWSDGTHNKTMILVSGDKYYYVTATDKYTCSANDSIKVKVQGIAPVTPFTMTGHCQNNEISLKDNSVLSDNTTKIIAYKWIIESDTLLSKDTTYTFKKAGLYYIKHIAITNGACSGSKTLPITIDPIPSISFIPKSVCQYSPVNFINTSSFNTSNSESIIWNIKGTKVEGKDTTTYKFNSYGLTDVSLTITTNDNCTDSLVKKVEVKFSPKAIFSNSPACELNDYFLFDNSTSPTAYGLTTRMWYINNLITQDQTVHLLPDSTQIGDNVLLKVTGVNGCFDTVSRFIPYSPIPKAALEFKNSCVGDITTFNDKSTVAKGSIVKWKWNIGNNIESYEQNPSVIFTESKTYPITLHITSDKGCEDTIVSQTKVIKKPIAGFDYNPKIAGAPIDISFTNTSDSATSYKWTFGDLESSTLFEPIHEYSDSGKYTVSLYAYNNYMCVDSSKKTINLQKANYKIELYSITSTDKNGYVTVSTVFINAGLNPLTNIDFILTKDDGTNVKETWKGLNTTGVIDTFTFASKFKVSNGTELPKYICIDAKVIGKQDSIVAANSKCITNLKDFTFLSAYPIPANDNLTFTFVSPEKGNAQYAIYSSIGQIIMENSVAIVDGINKLTIPTHTLIEGYYIWKLNVAGKEKTGKLLISRNSK